MIIFKFHFRKFEEDSSYPSVKNVNNLFVGSLRSQKALWLSHYKFQMIFLPFSALGYILIIFLLF